MANAKLSGSLLERKDVLPSTTLALSEPSDASVNGSLANRFESVNAALCDADSKDAASAQAMTAAGRSVSCSPTGEGNRRFATIIAFCGFAATISGFLFLHSTTDRSDGRITIPVFFAEGSRCHAGADGPCNAAAHHHRNKQRGRRHSSGYDNTPTA